MVSKSAVRFSCLQLLRQKYPGVKSLRDATVAMIDETIGHDHIVYKRCKYVVEENTRVIDGCKDLLAGDLEAFGKKMFATHKGLSKMYEVSCNELDIMVDLVKHNKAAIGARMMGGGFGGCTINIVKEDAVEELIYDTREQYREKTGMNLNAYIASIEGGANIIRKI